MSEGRWLSVAAAAQRLQVSASTVLRMLHDGELPSRLIRYRIIQIPLAAIEAYARRTYRDWTGGAAPPAAAPKGGKRLAAGTAAKPRSPGSATGKTRSKSSST